MVECAISEIYEVASSVIDNNVEVFVRGKLPIDNSNPVPFHNVE